VAEPSTPTTPGAPPAPPGNQAPESDEQRALREMRDGNAVPMLDPTTGQRVYVDPDSAHQLFLDHKLQYERGQTYVIQGPDGSTQRVGAQEAAAYSDSNPYSARLGLVRDKAREEQEEQRGGFAGMARTAGEGALDELTLGGAAVAGRALGGDGYQARRQLDQTVNEGSDVVGRGFGLGLGLLVGTGEAEALGLGAKAVRGATAGVRGVVRAGEAAEGLARTAGLGLGLTEGGLGLRVATGAARAGTEMALFSGGAEVARQAVFDADYDAERALSAAVRGAGEGALLGGGLGLAAGGLAKLGAKAEGAADALATRARGSELRAELARAEALRSTGATGADLREFAAGRKLTADGQRVADRILAAEKEVGVPLQQWAAADAAEFFGGKAREAGARIGKALELAEGGAPGMPLALRQVIGDAADRAITLEGKAATKAEGKAAWRYLSDLATELDAQPVGAVFDARAGLDRALRESEKRGGEGVLNRWRAELVEQLEGVVKGTLKEAELSGGPGAKGLHAAYEAARLEYKDAIRLQQLYESGLDKGTVEGLNGLKALLYGGGPASSAVGAVGAAAGGLVAGAPGAFVGRELGGLFGRPLDAAVKRALKDRGSNVAAQALRDLGAKPTREVATTAARGLLGLPAVDPALAAAQKGAAALAKPAPGAVTSGGRGVAGYAVAASRAARALGRVADPAAGAAFAQTAASQLRRSEREAREGARRAAQARTAALAVGRSPDALDGPLAAAADARAQLAAEALTEPETPPAGTPYQVELPASQSHADLLEQRREILARPERAPKLAAEGRLTADQIDLLAMTMPIRLEAMRTATAAALEGAKGQPTPASLVGATLLLGAPAAPEMHPRALQAIQASHARARAEAQQTGGPRGPNRPAAGGRAARSGIGLPGEV
jgi:hypothetical protein